MSFAIPLALALQIAASQNPEAPFTPDIRAAELTLVDALQHHDRAAFERLVASDAVFFLPSLLQGRDAIVQGWIPFLIETGSTLVLSPAKISGSADISITEGTLAVTGNGPVRPVASMTYVGVWKRAAEGWQLYSFSAAAAARPVARPTLSGGVGDYRFGMTRAQVRQVGACQPYLDVPSTGGLECPNFTFDGRKMNVSFVFAGDTLRRVQLWYYEGKSEKDAKKAVDAILDYFQREGLTVHSYEMPAPVTTDDVFKALKKMPGTQAQPGTIQIVSESSSRPEQIHARVIKVEDGYMAFLFFSAR
jgi:ketosteroid isomerase-like protein